MAKPLIDLTGKKIGHLEVLCLAENQIKKGRQWFVRCDVCKRVFIKTTSDMNRRDYTTRSCQLCHNRRINQTHGETGTPLHDLWCGMRGRCHFPQHQKRGYYFKISICDAWENSYEVFRDWAIKNGYKQGLTLDRINTYGNYEPNNCRFVGWKEQNRNRRNVQRLTIGGMNKSIPEWAEENNLNSGIIKWRIKHNWPTERLLISRTNSTSPERGPWWSVPRQEKKKKDDYVSRDAT